MHTITHIFFVSYSSFGTWKIPVGQTTTDQVDQAISVGFRLILVSSFIVNVQINPNICFPSFLILWNDQRKTPHRPITMKPIQIWPFERADSNVKISMSLVTTKFGGLNGLDIENSIQISSKNVCIFISFLQRMIQLIHIKISGWLHSWESNTSICTSSIKLNWLFLISQPHGRRWKISKQRSCQVYLLHFS
jgi:hypothetical protein